MIGILLAINLILNVVMTDKDNARITLKVPADKIQPEMVMMFPVQAPDAEIFLNKTYNAKTDKWIYKTIIKRHNKREWMAVAQIKGKVAFAAFTPDHDQEITLQVQNIASPTVSGTAGNYTITAASAPTLLKTSVKRVELMVNREVMTSPAAVAEKPLVCYAKYYLTEGNDKWVSSDWYTSE